MSWTYSLQRCTNFSVRLSFQPNRSRRKQRRRPREVGGVVLVGETATYQPHSLKPHTWHFTHPSAYSSCEPQSGHVPMNDCCAPLSNANCACSPVGVACETVISSRDGSDGPRDSRSSSCWIPSCFS